MPKSRSPRDQEFDPIGLLFFVIILVCFFAYQWVVANWNTIVFVFEIIVAIVVVCIVAYVIYYVSNYSKIQQEEEMKERILAEAERARQREFEQTERARQKEREDVARKEAEFRTTLFGRIIDTIEKFEPTKAWEYEEQYHLELHGFLKAHFPNTKFEFMTGSSRPDLVIDHVAIEIKGPTNSQALQTIADKCMRYSHHYEKMIVVLFDPVYSEGRFYEFKKGMENHFPHVKIIVK